MTKLLPFIDEELNGIIWRIEIDTFSNILFLEVRNAENKEVSFASIDLTSGNINFKHFTLPERWLIGMEGAYQGKLILHYYQSATSPVHKGVVAVNGADGKISWNNYTYAFDSFSVNGLVAYNTQIQPKKQFLIDIETGLSVRPYNPAIDNIAENDIVTPDLLPVSALPTFVKIEPHGNYIHYLEYNKYRIVSLHSFKGGMLKQYLYVIHGAGIVYEDILNDDIQKLQPEAFILHKNCLIYIKNKFRLKALIL